jgi:formylglycine-generating enzyme required for sulfatase activity
MNTKHFLRAVIAILSIAFAVPASAQCTGDLTGNGIVDGADLGTILSYWGPRTQDPTSVASDLNGDGLISGADLGVLLASWGPCQSTITSITPNQGCIVGGTQITINGTYLGSTSAVSIGGTPARSFTVVNGSTLLATTPAGTLGPANVDVTTAAGTITASQQFTYMPASVSSIVPNAGPVAGGTEITITGAYLGLTTGVTVGGGQCTNVMVVNNSTVRAVTPTGSLGSTDVVVTGSKGSATVPEGYRYVSVLIPSWGTFVEAEPDPSVITDSTLRAAIASTGFAWRVRDTDTGIEMLLIPPGTFQMGCVMGSIQSGCLSWEFPVHQVTLTNAFYIGRFEVTQAQWTARMGSNPSYFQGQPDSASRPVEQVSWSSARRFASDAGMRLPTEAEWEFACRAGTQTPFYNGLIDAATVGSLGWIAENSESRTHAVGGKASNGFGLFDMLGNVWEWVNDYWSVYLPTAQVNPTGPATGTTAPIRGGSCYGAGYEARSSVRDNGILPLNQASINVGFRVARNP